MWLLAQLNIIIALFLTVITSTQAATLFTRDLYIGIRNDPEVMRLQEFLRNNEFFDYPESTGNYFAVTQNAIVRFQLAHGIEPAVGYFGPLTRATVNEMISISSESGNDITTDKVADELFPSNLYFGLRDNTDVIRLQEILRFLGFFTYPESTGNYFSITEQAVQHYQQSRNIMPANGEFHGTTRFIINQEVLAGIIPTDGESITQLPSAGTATSTYYEIITIRSFSGRSDDPLRESVRIRNISRDKPVNITGWQLKTNNGQIISIPQVYNLPGILKPTLQDLILAPRGTVIITIGRQSLGINFRENICTGYFREQTTFKPSISRSCPKPDTEKLLHLDDKCLTTLKGIGTCQTPKQGDYFAQSSECSDYMIKNLNYAGCVRNNKLTDDFYEDEWYIWLQRDTEMFRNIHDVITLYDTSGRFVDRREY